MHLCSRCGTEGCALNAGPDCKLPLCSVLLGKLWNNTVSQLNTQSEADAAAALATQTLSVHASVALTGAALVRSKGCLLRRHARSIPLCPDHNTDCPWSLHEARRPHISEHLKSACCADWVAPAASTGCTGVRTAGNSANSSHISLVQRRCG